jgi:hypothetical protein
MRVCRFADGRRTLFGKYFRPAFCIFDLITPKKLKRRNAYCRSMGGARRRAISDRILRGQNSSRFFGAKAVRDFEYGKLK